MHKNTPLLHIPKTEIKVLITLLTDTEENCCQQIRNFEGIDLFLTQIQHIKRRWDFPTFKKHLSSFFMSKGAKLYMFFQSGPMKLKFLYSLKGFQDQISSHSQEMVKQFLPIHWSSLVSTPKKVYWYLLGWKLARQKCQGVL